MPDVALIGQDPGFGGGAQTLMEALWRAAEQLGREPELHYLRHRALDGREGSPLRGHGVGPRVPGLDAANILAASVRIARRVQPARARFVCAAVPAHGYGAVLAHRPFGCWAATSIASESSARRAGLDAPRRAALALNAPALRAFDRATLRNATVVWATSPSARRELAAAGGIAESAIRIVPVPVDLERFAPLPDAEWERLLAQPELVFIGRADDTRKNLGLLLDAFDRLRSRMPGVRLTLVGSPPTRSVPAGVEVAGEVASVVEHLRRAALFVLPSLQEGFGIVVAEALACGVPVLVTPSGGPEALVHESQGGEVLSGFGAEELAERAAALLGDPATLAAMRHRGREYARQALDPALLREALRDALEELEHAR